MGTILVRAFVIIWYLRNSSFFDSQSAPLGGQLHVPYIKVSFIFAHFP